MISGYCLSAQLKLLVPMHKTLNPHLLNVSLSKSFWIKASTKS